MINIKQIIILRKDLNMRKGKMVAQGSHASMAFLKEAILSNASEKLMDDPIISEWLSGEQKKICLSVDSEAQMIELYEKAKALGLRAHLIYDLGHTEFHGVKTLTALCLGPELSESLDPLTSSLSLL